MSAWNNTITEESLILFHLFQAIILLMVESRYLLPAGWGDAVVIVPWVLYEQYGNIETLRENYPAMKKWVEYIRVCAESGCAPDIDPNDQKRMERQKYLWNTGQNLGDWLIPSLVADGSVENMLKCSYLTQEYISTCFYAHSSEILSKTA